MEVLLFSFDCAAWGILIRRMLLRRMLRILHLIRHVPCHLLLKEKASCGVVLRKRRYGVALLALVAKMLWLLAGERIRQPSP